MPAPSPTDIRMLQRAPCAALRPFVQQLIAVECLADVRDSHLPDTASVLAFSFRERCRLDDGRAVPAAAFTGLQDRLRGHAHPRGHSLVLAKFTPVGAAALLRPPQDAFAGATVDLDDLDEPDRGRQRLLDQLAAASGAAARLDRLEAYLLHRLGHARPDPLVAAAIDWLQRAPADARIETLSRYIGLSQSALERRFRRIVGVTPKRYATTLRLERALSLYRPGSDLTELALRAGYYDQAHFNHDFRRAAGRSPGAYFDAA
ncbi:AraC family transcriptional regulator [Lysobacter sp. BMK333-48F3]|uniref:helix-turn-helix transcriptional regulator n=1 Tax=Lysobacter sp. BMK333-48F3 TaxID=2867962 RepID=UPI001C8CC4E6|nr:AraC family transcriptional regulator [Lysobacter sp. BMK333-48F3]MBX9402286.1 AraC family transcriptional regulator [Lysobacter sp. BMK333-48F3]